MTSTTFYKLKKYYPLLKDYENLPNFRVVLLFKKNKNYDMKIWIKDNQPLHLILKEIRQKRKTKDYYIF